MLKKKKDYMLGEELIQREWVTLEQVERALEIQRESHEFLGQILIRLKFLSEQNLLTVLADQYELETVDPLKLKVTKTILERVPAKVAHHYHIFPVERRKNSARVAMSEIPDPDVLQELGAILGSEVKIALAERTKIDEAIEQHYGIGAPIVERMVATKKAAPQPLASVIELKTEKTDATPGEASVRELVNMLFIDAKTKRASDIHIEPFPRELVVRYRVDGILQEAKVPQEIRQFHSGIISRIKIMSQLDISEHRVPQDGRVKVEIEGEELDLRISLLPTSFGESLVIRILSPTRLLKMDQVGLSEAYQKELGEQLKSPHGIILLTGPTGSGKTTTLYAALNEINNSGRKIITVEDPIEYQLRGIVQTQVNPKIGVTFATGLRHMLRHDPDVMMVGEIRDAETAEIAVRSALTGHLVFSTLHTNDAPSSLIRLLDLDLPPYLVSSSIICVIAQRLVRKVCEKCRNKSSPTELKLSQLKNEKIPEGTFYTSTGCDACRGTGYHGRVAIHEMMMITQEMKELINKKASLVELQKLALSQGMTTLQKDGIAKASQGITTVSEVLRVTR
jgi:type IV pilus assembly protein PilB